MCLIAALLFRLCLNRTRTSVSSSFLVRSWFQHDPEKSIYRLTRVHMFAPVIDLKAINEPQVEWVTIFHDGMVAMLFSCLCFHSGKMLRLLLSDVRVFCVHILMDVPRRVTSRNIIIPGSGCDSTMAYHTENLINQGNLVCIQMVKMFHTGEIFGTRNLEGVRNLRNFVDQLCGKSFLSYICFTWFMFLLT